MIQQQKIGETSGVPTHAISPVSRKQIKSTKNQTSQNTARDETTSRMGKRPRSFTQGATENSTGSETMKIMNPKDCKNKGACMLSHTWHVALELSDYGGCPAASGTVTPL